MRNDEEEHEKHQGPHMSASPMVAVPFCFPQRTCWHPVRAVCAKQQTNASRAKRHHVLSDLAQKVRSHQFSVLNMFFTIYHES